jgi:hypothetical protein
MKYPAERLVSLMDIAEWESEVRPSFIELSPDQYNQFTYIVDRSVGGEWRTFRGRPVVMSEKE